MAREFPHSCSAVSSPRTTRSLQTIADHLHLKRADYVTAGVVLVNCQLVFKRMARTRVASPFARRGEGEGFSQRECAAWRDRTPHLNPLPLAKGRGETNGMELTTGEHYQLPGKLLGKY